MGSTLSHFESEACSRCGGTGRHSFNGQHSICYKCGGAKMTLTRAGLAARAAWLEANIDEVSPAEIRVGDTIRTSHATLSELMSGGGGRDYITAVTAVDFRESTSDRIGHGTGGVWTRDNGTYTITTKRTGSLGVCEHFKVKRWTARVALPPEMAPGTPRRAEMKAFVAAAKDAAARAA